MRPDDEDVVPFDGIGADPALDALVADLAEAGERARADKLQAPRAAFAADLRGRLLAGLPITAPAGAPPVERSRPAAAAPEPFAPRQVVPRITARTPRLLPAPRWSVLAVAAAIMVALIGLGPSHLFTRPADLRVGDVASATLSRDGVTTDLASAQVLRAGDLITTGPDGHATLELGTNRARLGGGTEVRLVAASTERVALVQTAGRVWHRVGGPAIEYAVRTADVTWTADGTAFDLRLEVDPADGSTWARVIGVEHDVAISGPSLSATLDEGAVARIRLGGSPGIVSDVALGPITTADLDDPWLIANARRDARLGFAVGIFDTRLAEIDPSPSPTSDGVDLPAPTDASVIDPPTPGPTSAPIAPVPTATAKPTAKPTAHPTPTPKPTPKPKPPVADLGSSATACDGGFTRLAWTIAPKSGFNHYQTIRSSKPSIPAVYPPAAPGVAPELLFVGERSKLGAVDAGLEPGTTYNYRTMAFDADDKATAASGVKTVTAKAVKALGTLTLAPQGAGFDADWAAYGGPDGCFGFYKLVVSTTDETPSYFEGATAVWVGESAGTHRGAGGCARPGHVPRAPRGDLRHRLGQGPGRRDRGRRHHHPVAQDPGYSPVNRGGRFARKAAIPSA